MIENDTYQYLKSNGHSISYIGGCTYSCKRHPHQGKHYRKNPNGNDDTSSLSFSCMPRSFEGMTNGNIPERHTKNINTKNYILGVIRHICR